MDFSRNLFSLLILSFFACTGYGQSYPVVDTDVSSYYSDIAEINTPPEGEAFYGQDASYTGNLPSYSDNGDGTISDLATGLMWQGADDGNARDWEEALAYAEGLELGGKGDWRLPNAKELQSIVDYGRSPQTSDSPSIDPLFETSEITDPEGNPGQYPYFWTSTTHLDGANPFKKESGISINIYPNPVKKLINISSDQRLCSIAIYNMSGQKLIEQPADENRSTINTASLPDGAYLINILSDKGESIYGHFNKIH